ncbi:hypothetical protein BLNAU_21577 [Blattamonas nauphoetae]|uniref:Saposin B-type domain-containing protein n=1 Tax=Blattamonas nauphoetae TaxID=2049346 RepID=A0ABQ9WVI6_9EUKA|nr:hypothetical protein BLNAU_21577 [Blattamonas nauphoetae]
MFSVLALALINSAFSWNEDFDYDYDFDEYALDEEYPYTLEELDSATKCEICVDLVTASENFVQTYGGKYLKDFIRNKACTKVPELLKDACADIGEKVIEVALRELVKLLDPSKVCKKIKMC